MKKLTTQEFIDKCKKTHKNRFDYSKLQYIDSYTKVEIICPIHGSFYQLPSDHRRGFGCSKCSNKARNTLQGFVIKARAIHGACYDYSRSKFSSLDSRIEIDCPKHGIFRPLARSHIYGSKVGCPKCNRSKGEVRIATTLIELGIEFEEQKIFKGCLGRFDFYIPKLNLCIEYDGAQHFHERHIRRHLNKKEQFDLIKKRDRKKNRFCKKIGLNLLRISYKQFNKIQNIISNAICNNSTSL